MKELSDMTIAELTHRIFELQEDIKNKKPSVLMRQIAFKRCMDELISRETSVIDRVARKI